MNKLCLFLFSCFQLFCFECLGRDNSFLEGKCPCGCCMRYMDSEIYDIEKLLEICLLKISFKSNFIEQYIMGSKTSYSGDRLYYFLGNRKLLGEDGSFFMVCLEDSYEENYNPFENEEWSCPDDLEYSLSKNSSSDFHVVALENYLHFVEFSSFFKNAVIEVTQDTLLKLKQRMEKNRDQLQEGLQNQAYAISIWREKTDVSYDYFSLRELEKKILSEIKKDKEAYSEIEKNLQKKLEIIDSTEDKIQKIYEHIFSWCIEKHKFYGSFYNRGFYNFHLGNYFGALQDLQNYIEGAKKLSAQVYILKGELHLELAMYNDAVIALSKAAELDPVNKDALFNRARCYFELGNFDLSLQDFLKLDYKSTPLDKNSMDWDFAAGLLVGTGNGIQKGAFDFIPSILSSANGLSHGLWSFITSPIECSKEVVQTAKEVIQVLLEYPYINTLTVIIPELKELIENKNLSNFKKGEIFGYIIGKYGTDAITVTGSFKAVKALSSLKKANNILTLEKLSKETALITEKAAFWEKTHIGAIEKIKKGEKTLRQYKGYYSENEVRRILHQLGFKTFARPKGIPENFKITFSDKGGGMKYVHPERTEEYIRVMPGKIYSPNSWQQKPYVQYQTKGGVHLDKYGNKVAGDSKEAHIPIDEFIYFTKE